MQDKSDSEYEEQVDTAIRPGGAIQLSSKNGIGLFANYAAVGVLYGGFPSLVYPFLLNYLNLKSYQAEAAYSLISIPWSLKLFVGIVSDSFPIFGYRRKSYMILGWTLCTICLIVLAALPAVDPYYLHPNDMGKTIHEIKNSYPHTWQDRFNQDAPNNGSIYIMLMSLATLAYVVADVAADGIVVEFAQREPEAIRGRTQTAIYCVRTLFSSISISIIGFGLNGLAYGGNFHWSLQFRDIMIMMAVAAASAIPFTIYFLEESRVEHRQSFRVRCHEMWCILKNRAIWQIMAYKFCAGFFSSFNTTAENNVKKIWAKVTPLNTSIFDIIGNLLFAATMVGTGKWGLQWNWRTIIATTSIAAMVLDAIPTFITVFNVFRNQWFWLGMPLIETLPTGIRFIISTYIVVEIATENYEAATYGLLTTISNLSTPFAATFYKTVDSYFQVDKETLKTDTSAARWDVTYTYLIMYAMKLISLGFLVLLPKQKREAQHLKQFGGSSTIGGICAIIGTAIVLSWALMANLLSVFESTNCLRIAGGTGC